MDETQEKKRVPGPETVAKQLRATAERFNELLGIARGHGLIVSLDLGIESKELEIDEIRMEKVL